ncbi:hypothetical protein H4R34_002638 [Dimargaris verticillata]|uniref:pH-response regulator protein palC n=1 Tax=Dimargaris verticillata TaxID=2761393 RepID=A0A9W8E934_9FUNG|nr:hypothetical protein H4R34_002638 [Dimargaris verticillata]
MHFYLPVPKTKSVSLLKRLGGPGSSADSGVVQGLTDATAHRERMRQLLKSAHEQPATADFAKVVAVIEDYLPHLFWCVRYEDTLAPSKTAIATIRRGRSSDDDALFVWKSPLCTGLGDGTKFTTMAHRLRRGHFASDSLAFELGGTLMAYGLALASWAFRQVQHLSMVGQTQQLPDHDTQRYKQAMHHLCQAAGVYDYILRNVAPKLAESSAANSQGQSNPRPPELTSEMLQILSRLAMADAQRIAIRLSMAQNRSPSLMAKLLLGVGEEYDAIFGLFQTMPSQDHRDMTAELRRYLKDHRIYFQACAQRYLAMDAHQHDLDGVALGFVDQARIGMQTLRAKDRTPIVHEATLLLAELDQERATYDKLNRTVTFDPVPSPAELNQRTPSGRTLMEMTVFTPPALRNSQSALPSPTDATESSHGQQYALQHAYY